MQQWRRQASHSSSKENIPCVYVFLLLVCRTQAQCTLCLLQVPDAPVSGVSGRVCAEHVLCMTGKPLCRMLQL